MNRYWMILFIILAAVAMLASTRGLPGWLTDQPHGLYDTDEQHRRNGEL